MSIIKDAIEKIEELVLNNNSQRDAISPNNNEQGYFFRGEFKKYPQPKIAAQTKLNSLDSLISYCSSRQYDTDINRLNSISDDRQATVIQVEHDSVVVQSSSTRFGDKHAIATAIIPEQPRGFTKSFETYCELDVFAIWLRCHFRQSADRDLLIKVVSSVTSGTGVETADDGVSQTVTVKTGITKLGKAELPSVIELIPLRTFSEIILDPVPFVFRIKQDGNGQPRAALFSCDGDAWKIDAREKIQKYLEKAFETRKIFFTIV